MSAAFDIMPSMKPPELGCVIRGIMRMLEVHLMDCDGISIDMVQEALAELEVDDEETQGLIMSILHQPE